MVSCCFEHGSHRCAVLRASGAVNTRVPAGHPPSAHATPGLGPQGMVTDDKVISVLRDALASIQERSRPVGGSAAGALAGGMPSGTSAQRTNPPAGLPCRAGAPASGGGGAFQHLGTGYPQARELAPPLPPQAYAFTPSVSNRPDPLALLQYGGEGLLHRGPAPTGHQQVAPHGTGTCRQPCYCSTGDACTARC